MITVGTKFMADLKLKCDSCGGRRFQDHILDITTKEKMYSTSFNDNEDALLFFQPEEGEKMSTTVRKLLKNPTIVRCRARICSLGQGSNTLSGGEAQRIKLVLFFKRKQQGHTLFVFDEPTTGLHIHDVAKLLEPSSDLFHKDILSL